MNAHPLELWGPGEVCRAFDVSRKTFAQWREKGFPAPYAELSIGPVWLADDVRAWGLEKGKAPAS